ncbi:spore germination protein KC [Cohnella xylanilytica]|uniref:Ger(x)C family spore germination protein n=1 Tax=Cohnella xylanilytica TaxID=557555 RepID=UPI001B27EFEF|nr:Ger(x)C family spore germination protein [Cohnella xylanilytica]GIO12988.1 spore germination protein KC [Cohnella xylanilytica]
MKTWKLIVSLLAILPLAGCWDRTELNELSITAATSFDRDEDQWVVSYQVVIPSAISGSMGNVKGGASQLPVIVYSTHGPTIREAVFQSAFESPRKLFFSHNRVVVISDEVARQGLKPIIDVYFRNPDVRETVNVLIAEGKARKIIEQLMQIQIIPGDGIFETMRTENRLYSALPSTNMYELAMELTSSARNAAIPEILISGSRPVTTSDQMNSTTLSSKIRLGRLALLKDGKLAGWLSQDEALGVSFLRNKVNQTVISFPCKASDPKLASSVQIKGSKTRIVPVKKGDSFRFRADIKAQGALLETNCGVDLEKPEVIRQMESQVRAQAIELIRRGFQATQKLQTDVVGFADAIHRRDPRAWHRLEKNWPAEYARVGLDIRFDFTIKRMGLSNKSFKKVFEQRED